MSKFRQILCCAIFCAALSFSWALATSNSRDIISSIAKQTAQSRFIGQSMRFTNPFFVAGTNPDFPFAGDPEFPQGGDVQTDPDGFDLGDVSFDNPFVRYFSAAGGYLPRVFTLQPILNGSAIPSSWPTISRNGKLTGNIAPITSNALRFAVQLTDFIATQRVGIFKLNLFPRTTNFRFAHSQLPTAQLGGSYYTNIETIGGQSTARFDALSGSISAQGNVSRLEDVGLTLSPDGALFGRPLVAAPIKFTARASDANANIALARIGSAYDQTFTIPVEANNVTTTELTSIICRIYGHTITLGEDSFIYVGILDGKGDIAPTLAGSTFTLRVGGASFTGKLDAKGKSFDVKGNCLGAQGKFAFSFSPRNGRVNIKICGANLNAALGAADFNGAYTRNIIIGLEIGALRTCEVLTIMPLMSGEHYKLCYRLGKNAMPACGAFQILTVHGADAKENGLAGDRWIARCLGAPRGIDGATGITDVSNVTVRIGAAFSQSVNVAVKLVRLEFKATSKDRGIWQLLLNPENFIHRIQTNILTGAEDTGIPAAGETNDATLPPDKRSQPALFSLGMNFQGLNGENGRIIIPARKSWSQR